MNPNNEEIKEPHHEEQKSHVRSKRDAKRLTVIQKDIPIDNEERDIETNSAPGVFPSLTKIPIQFAGKSKAGNVDGKHKTNQDSLISFNKFANRENYHLFGVFDGHGVYGHYASRFISDILPSLKLP